MPLSDEDTSVLRFSHEAMAADFEILIRGQDPAYARQAARAAFEEVDRLERDFSRFIASSDIAQINRLAPGERLLVGPDTLECMRIAERAWTETQGAFDPTIGALFALWRPGVEAAAEPSDEEIEEAKSRTGFALLELDWEERTIAVARQGVSLDLGAIGKGYALDRMADMLREWSIESALLHGAQSCALAIGPETWRVALRDPAGAKFGFLDLREQSLSGSGTAIQGLHIIDPRTGKPASDKAGAWALTESSALSDALSTGFMVMSVDEIEQWAAGASGAGAAALLVDKDGEQRFLRFGSWGGDPS